MVKDAENVLGTKSGLFRIVVTLFGAEWQGRMVGTSGDVAVYAFNISKLMTSIFGGMLTFQDRELAEKSANGVIPIFGNTAYSNQ